MSALLYTLSKTGGMDRATALDDPCLFLSICRAGNEDPGRTASGRPQQRTPVVVGQTGKMDAETGAVRVAGDQPDISVADQTG